jgi:hypothetical protein
MIIAPDTAFFDEALEYPRLEVAKHRGNTMERDASIVEPSRRCNLVVNEVYVKRLAILGFSSFDFISFRGESLRQRATIPVKESRWPLNGHDD